MTSSDLPFLGGYPASTLDQVRALIADGQLGDYLARRYPERHAVRNDGALYEHAMALKQRYLRNAPLLAKVVYDNRLQIDQRALGTLTAVSRVQGGQLKAKREIRVAALFKDAPGQMLQMIVVHELAHLKERDHDKAFYSLCEHMLPDYHQVEFDTRLYLTWRALEAAASAVVAAPPPTA
ncbi:MAG: M48 family metallopeptidase [Betaproteobacteria bacterium]